jgi:hypothetical protein
MADVQFFHQERVDGGRRSGVSVDGTTVFHAFIPGSEEYDPALEWYADVTLPTQDPPSESTVRSWLAANGQVIRDALLAAAGQLECGLDDSAMPWVGTVTVTWPEGQPRVSVSAVRRVSARHVGEKLRWLASQDWSVLFPTPTPVG